MPWFWGRRTPKKEDVVAAVQRRVAGVPRLQPQAAHAMAPRRDGR